MRFVLAVSFITVIFSGCVTQEQIKANRRWEHQYNTNVYIHIIDLRQLGKEHVAMDIIDKKISIGMTRNDVYYALRLSGQEDDGNLRTSRLSPGSNGYSFEIKVNRTVNRFGTSMQWVMPESGFNGPKYIYIDDGILTSWQGN